jgi:hypothetical protein
MNSIDKLFMTVTVSACVFSGNIHTVQAQNSSDLLVLNHVTGNTKNFGKGNSILIAQSRRTYVCDFISINQGVKLSPQIPGSITSEWNCYVPISAGRCVAIKEEGNPFAHLYERNPRGMRTCDSDSLIIKDPETGKQYYKFNAVSGDITFVLER